jgi:hypothetical protein
MNIKDENMEWETEAAYLASLPRTTPYRVPEQYFDDLQGRIKQSIFVANLGQRDNQGFKVPENYFEELNTQIESHISTTVLRELTQPGGFKVPVNYFDQLQSDILKQTIKAKQPVKIVKLWQSEAMKYVSAACIFLLVASGLYVNEQHNVAETAKVELANEHLLYDIDESVIFEHLQESQAATTNTATDVEMESYILDNFSSSDLANNL